jgi:HEAT repeat protein
MWVHLMETPIAALVREFVQQARVPPAKAEEDAPLEKLVRDFAINSAMSKRDMRRLMEKDPQALLHSACRILKAGSEGPGAAFAMEQLWSHPILIAGLIDPALLPLAAAIEFARRWQTFDSSLDIKLLHKGFPSEDGGMHEADIVRAKRALAIVNELPANRRILLPLVNLMCSSDQRVRSKAAAIYGRTCQNPDWVHKRLAEADPRIRANVVESLWGQDSDLVRAVLQEASRDRNHRVAVNALIGLHLSGVEGVPASLQQLALSSDPMARAAAAFGMGHLLEGEFKPALELLLKDNNPSVRGRALQALIRIRRQQQADQAPVAAADVRAEIQDDGEPPLDSEEAPFPDSRPAC